MAKKLNSTTTTSDVGYWLKCIFSNGLYGDFKKYLSNKCVKSNNRTAYNFLVSINKANLFKSVRIWYDASSSLHNIVKTEWL